MTRKRHFPISHQNAKKEYQTLQPTMNYEIIHALHENSLKTKQVTLA